MPRYALGGIDRLLLAARKGSELVFVGGVGTGFTARSGTALRRRLDARAIRKASAGVGKRKGVFVKPILVAEVEFRAWTNDEKLRDASFKRLREEADAASIYQIVMEDPATLHMPPGCCITSYTAHSREREFQNCR